MLFKRRKGKHYFFTRKTFAYFSLYNHTNTFAM